MVLHAMLPLTISMSVGYRRKSFTKSWQPANEEEKVLKMHPNWIQKFPFSLFPALALYIHWFGEDSPAINYDLFIAQTIQDCWSFLPQRLWEIMSFIWNTTWISFQYNIDITYPSNGWEYLTNMETTVWSGP